MAELIQRDGGICVGCGDRQPFGCGPGARALPSHGQPPTSGARGPARRTPRRRPPEACTSPTRGRATTNARVSAARKNEPPGTLRVGRRPPSATSTSHRSCRSSSPAIPPCRLPWACRPHGRGRWLRSCDPDRRAQDSSLARRLAPNRRVVCASPEYLRLHGSLRTPEELSQHNCLLAADFGGAWDYKAPDGRSGSARVAGRYIWDVRRRGDLCGLS